MRARPEALGPATRRVIGMLVTQPHLASYASTADLAGRASVSVATVVRTARALGFSGRPELRLEILARTTDVAAIRATADAIHAAGRTLVIGSGSFAAPGIQLAHISQTMGRDVLLQTHFGTQLINSLNRLGPGDCLVTVNLWWLPREVLEVTRMASEREVVTCVITDQRSSALADAATHLVVIPSEGISSFPSLTPAMAVVHAILSELARIGGEKTLESIAKAEADWSRLALFNSHD